MGCFGLTSLFKQKRQILTSELAVDPQTDGSRSRWKLSNGDWLLWPSRTRSNGDDTAPEPCDDFLTWRGVSVTTV